MPNQTYEFVQVKAGEPFPFEDGKYTSYNSAFGPDESESNYWHKGETSKIVDWFILRPVAPVASGLKWVKASKGNPSVYPANNTSDLHFKLDGRKVDGYMLDSGAFEYFNDETKGYSIIVPWEISRVEYLDESAPAGYSREQVRELLTEAIRLARIGGDDSLEEGLSPEGIINQLQK